MTMSDRTTKTKAKAKKVEENVMRAGSGRGRVRIEVVHHEDGGCDLNTDDYDGGQSIELSRAKKGELIKLLGGWTAEDVKVCKRLDALPPRKKREINAVINIRDNKCKKGSDIADYYRSLGLKPVTAKGKSSAEYIAELEEKVRVLERALEESLETCGSMMMLGDVMRE